MLANVNINLKPTTGILTYLKTTAALLDIQQQQYFNEQRERDIVDDLRTYGYLINDNDSFLHTDYDDDDDEASKALRATQQTNSFFSGSTASVTAAANSIQRSRNRITHPTFGSMSPEDFGNSSSSNAVAAYNDSSSSGGSGGDSIFLNGNLQDNFNFIIFNQSIGIGIGIGSDSDSVTGFIKNDSTHNNDSSSNSSLVDDVLLSGNEVLPMPEDVAVLLKMIIMSIVLGLMILITIIGNVFVIAAIILERNLQNVSNYLVVSLAVADLFVACLVMPLGAVYEISEGWILGPELCDIWTSCDVLCCTASILHLVAIATDRYWTVTNIDYHNLRTPRRIFCMIFTVWFLAVIVSLAPQFGWKDPEYMERIEQQKCMVSQDVIYQIFATCCSFYVPLLMILVLYWKIYKIARKRIQRRTQRLRYHNKADGGKEVDFQSKPIKRKRIKICFSKDVSSDKGFGAAAAAAADNLTNNSNPNMREETEFSTSNFDSKSHAGTELTNVSDENTTSMADERTPLPLEISTVSQQVAATTSTFQQHVTAIVLTSATPRLTDCSNSNTNSKQPPTQRQLLPSLLQSTTNPHHKLAKRRQQIEAKRERKAAQTLAIITGAFVVCWLPFFVMALLLSLCKSCEINAAVASLFLWLGYFNSTLNPIIYTIFNPEFRRAFQRLLFGKKYVASKCKRRSGNI